jgi:SGT1 protein
MSSMGEEDGEDVDESKRGKIDEKLQKYMKQMDQELSGTTIGQSFEKKTSEVLFFLI